MKVIIRALTEGIIERNLFYESVGFAFKEPPKDYTEYLQKSLEYAQEYSMDAIPISLRLNKQFIGFETATRLLSNVKSNIGLGLTYSSPFTRTAEKIGLTKFLSELHESRELQEAIKDETSKSISFLKRFEGPLDFVILIDPLSCNNVISPEYFKEFAIPTYYELSSNTSLPLVLHMPGKILGNLPFLLNSGVKGLQPIDKNSIEEVIEISKGKLQIIGNISNKVLAEGSDEEIFEEFKRCSDAHKKEHWIVHTDFWISKKTAPKKVRYLQNLIRTN